MTAAGIWKEAGSIARRLYDGGVSDSDRRARSRPQACSPPLAGTALFVWLVWKVGPGEIWSGFQQDRLGPRVDRRCSGGLRFAARAAAWALCIEPPHTPAVSLTAFNAVVCGDALGNVTPLGPLVERAGEDRLRARPRRGRRGAHRARDRERDLHAVGRGDDRRRQRSRCCSACELPAAAARVQRDRGRRASRCCSSSPRGCCGGVRRWSSTWLPLSAPWPRVAGSTSCARSNRKF